MSELTIPNTIQNGISADGDNLGENFQAIQDWADDHAAEKTYVDAHKPVAKFSRTTDVVLAGSASSDVTWEAETGDTLGYWESGVNITIPTNGLYAVTVTIVETAGNGIAAALWTRVSGSTAVDSDRAEVVGASTNQRRSATTIGYYSAADVFKVVVSNQDSFNAVTIGEILLHITQLAAY